jgi:membrane protease YdiL (CAAX protease family)
MKTTASVDALLVIITFGLASWVAHAAGLPGAGTWAVAAGIGTGAWRLRRAGLGFADVGLQLPAGQAGRTVTTAFGLVAIVMLAVGLLVLPLGHALGWPAQDLSRFAGMPGDRLAFAGYLLLAWVGAAFGEELLFRGLLLHRLVAAFGAAWGPLAVVLQAVLFGVGHAYLGARGVATAVVVGLVLGTAWLRNGGRLAPLVLAHGVIDSISLAAIYGAAAP